MHWDFSFLSFDRTWKWETVFCCMLHNSINCYLGWSVCWSVTICFFSLVQPCVCISCCLVDCLLCIDKHLLNPQSFPNKWCYNPSLQYLQFKTIAMNVPANSCWFLHDSGRFLLMPAWFMYVPTNFCIFHACSCSFLLVLCMFLLIPVCFIHVPVYSVYSVSFHVGSSYFLQVLCMILLIPVYFMHISANCCIFHTCSC